MTTLLKARQAPSTAVPVVTAAVEQASVLAVAAGESLPGYILWGAIAAAVAGIADAVSAQVIGRVALGFWEMLAAALFGAAALSPVGGVLGAAIGPAVRRLRPAALLRYLRRPRYAAAAVLGVSLLCVGAAAAARSRGILLEAVRYRPFVLALIGATAFFVGSRYFGAPRRCIRALLFWFVAVAVLFAVTAVSISHSNALPRFLGGDTVLVRPVFQGVRAVFDGDGDGFPRVLCRADCDCDDKNSKRNPAAIDIPDNGVDEDCSGGDLSRADVRARLTASLSDTVYPETFAPPMNIVLITIDTLRADRLHVYGHSRPTSPNLDRFAMENVRFAQVRSQGPSTRHVFPVLLTGRYFPTVRQTKGKKWWRLLPDNVTFAELMRNAGYRTAAVLPYFRFKEGSGFEQGFESWETKLGEGRDATWAPTGDLVTERGIEHLKRFSGSKQPFLLWLHYFDVHASYVRHADQPSFGTERADRYDGEVLFVDRQVGRFFDALKATGQWDTTAVIVTSDHGEGIGLPTDHGFDYHGFSLYDSETRIPLMMRAPGMGARVVERSVALIDLPPTLLALAGVNIPANLHGVSLLPWAFGSTAERGPYLMHLPEAAYWEAAVDWPYKLIWEKKPNRFQLFDLSVDPNEQRDIAAAEPQTVKRLRDWMQLENYRIRNRDGQGKP